MPTVRFRCMGCTLERHTAIKHQPQQISSELLIFIHPMRNTTKLKQILLKYDLDLSMDDDGILKITLIDKNTRAVAGFEHSSYSSLLNKSYSHFLKELKMQTRPGGKKTK